MSTLADQWLEVFRAGDYGAKGKFTEQDLRAIASSYDPSLHEAPVVIGRPEMNAPAFGWVEKLRAHGGTLLAKLRQVQPALEDMVSRGLFKKRSNRAVSEIRGHGYSLPAAHRLSRGHASRSDGIGGGPIQQQL